MTMSLGYYKNVATRDIVHLFGVVTPQDGVATATYYIVGFDRETQCIPLEVFKATHITLREATAISKGGTHAGVL